MRERFSVDTHLFRELGELLVGRDSTALVELIKNAYDADATKVLVHAENLQSQDEGQIVVKDNGHGMTVDAFRDGFLRIASRVKEEGERRSPGLHRRYTGAKGIGRLAAHKLARTLEIDSVATDPKTNRPLSGFRANIDWKRIEEKSTLEEVAQTDAITLTVYEVSPSAKGGTTMTLRNLRRAWSDTEITAFVEEARETRPPSVWIAEPSKKLLEQPLLLGPVEVHSSNVEAGQWDLELSGDFDIGEPYFQQVADAASWILEVNAQQDDVKFGIAPTKRYAQAFSDSRRVTASLQQPVATALPRFQARVFIRDGDWEQKTAAAEKWRNLASGVRLYLEGFRVLPYGERGNDWLDLDKSYSRRVRTTDALTDGLFESSSEDENAPLLVIPNRSVWGAVFLTIEKMASLKILVNREGFQPDNSYSFIQEVMKRAMGFAIRVRSEARRASREERKTERLHSAVKKLADAREATPVARLEASVQKLNSIYQDVEKALATGNVEEAKRKLAPAEESIIEVPALTSEVRDQQAMIRVLASLGTQMAAFVHEINALLALASAVERSISSVAEAIEGPRKVREAMARGLAQVIELRRSLERQGAFLTNVASADSRRRRSRQSLKDRFDAAFELLAHHADRRAISVENKISAELRSPPMFRAELIAVFTNLLSNALKAAGEKGRILASGEERDKKTIVRIENTGVSVDPSEGEKWFKPFASSTADVDVGMGQGMGLGLTITRRLLEEYGSEIMFEKPSKGFATCLQITFPD